MRRKSLLLTAGLLLVLLGGTGTGLYLLVRQEPDFYHAKAISPGERRKKLSSEFQVGFVDLMTAIKNELDDWQVSFSEAQINSYFEEDFLSSGVARTNLPPEVSAPRVSLEQDSIRLAFRYGSPPWSAIVSIDFGVWLAPKEPNVVALELRGVHAGSLPISAQSLLDQVTEIGRRKDIEVTWFRHNGNPVALLHFLSDKPHPTVQLQNLQIRNGALTLRGRCLDKTPHIRVSGLPQTPQGN
jgi:hypothetical protein